MAATSSFRAAGSSDMDLRERGNGWGSAVVIAPQRRRVTAASAASRSLWDDETGRGSGRRRGRDGHLLRCGGRAGGRSGSRLICNNAATEKNLPPQAKERERETEQAEGSSCLKGIQRLEEGTALSRRCDDYEQYKKPSALWSGRLPLM